MSLEFVASTLSQLFPPSARPAQHDFAQCVAAAFDATDPDPTQPARLIAVQADTGTGKSRAYLAAAGVVAGFGEKVVIATHSHALMRQLVEHEAPAVRAMLAAQGLPADFTLAVRLGRRNFVSRQRVEALAAADARFADWRAYLADSDASGTFAEAAESFGLQVPAPFTQDDLCVLPGERSQHFDAHRRTADDAHVVITSHAMLLADARRWGRVLTQRTARRVAIIDEADALANAAENDAVARVSFAALAALADKTGGVARVRAWTRDLRALASERCVAAGEAPVAIVGEVAAWLRDLDAEGELADERDALLADLGEWLENVEARDAGSLVERAGLSTASVDAGRVVSRLWNAGKERPAFLRAAVLVSATLAPNDQNDFTELLRRVGVFSGNANFDAQASQVIALDEFGAMRFALADRAVPAPFAGNGTDNEAEPDRRPTLNPQWIDYVVAGIEAAWGEGGRVLVLTASYADADAIGSKLRDVLVHGRGTKLGYWIEQFKAAPDAVLLTPAAWAGVDLPGLISHVVIPRIPFGPIEAPVDAAYRKVAEARGWSAESMRGLLVQRRRADAARRLRQGMGRGIRTATDEVQVWLLDPRFPLPSALLRNLRLRLTQGAAEPYVALAGAIPRRFRAAYEKASIFGWNAGRQRAA